MWTGYNHIFNTDCPFNDYFNICHCHCRCFWRRWMGGRSPVKGNPEKMVKTDWQMHLKGSQERLLKHCLPPWEVFLVPFYVFFERSLDLLLNIHGPWLFLLQGLLVGGWCKKLKRIRSLPVHLALWQKWTASKSTHPCMVQRHCECLPGKSVIINRAVRKKGPPVLQGVDSVEASPRFYILLCIKQYRRSRPITVEMAVKNFGAEMKVAREG